MTCDVSCDCSHMPLHHPKNKIKIKEKKKINQIKKNRLKQNKIKIKYKGSYYKMSYLLVVILELNSVSEVQYEEIMIIGDE